MFKIGFLIDYVFTNSDLDKKNGLHCIHVYHENYKNSKALIHFFFCFCVTDLLVFSLNVPNICLLNQKEILNSNVKQRRQ